MKQYKNVRNFRNFVTPKLEQNFFVSIALLSWGPPVKQKPMKSKKWQGFSPKTFFRIFDRTILPIMNYGAEIWSGNEWSALEKLHLLARKHVLGVPQSTQTDGIYTELGRHPIIMHRKISIIKYLKRFSS